MTFRDDRDALIAQRDALEAEVRDLRSRAEQAEDEVAAHQAKDRDAGREIVALRREVATLRASLGETQPPRARRSLALAAAAGAVLVAMLAGVTLAVTFLVRGEPARTDPPPVTSWHAPAPFAAPPPVAGSVSATALNGVVSRNRPQLRRCYEAAIHGAAEPPIARVEVRVTVAPTGEVSDAAVRGDRAGEALRQCVASTVRRWRFPGTGEPVVTEFPVVFAPAS